MIQQAVSQVLQPIFDPTFSDNSFGFRPGRSTHGAVLRAYSYIEEGAQWVVDLDLEKFFDRVNHDVLMARVARRVKDCPIPSITPCRMTLRPRSGTRIPGSVIGRDA